MEGFDPQKYNTVEELQAALEAHQHKLNRMPREDFDFLCALDVHHILYDTFGENSPIQIRKIIKKELLAEMPFLNLVYIFLSRLQEAGELKLTPKGNLPTKWVKELYVAGGVLEEMLASGISKLYKQDDSKSITNMVIIAAVAKLTKKRNNKLSLTQKGQKLLAASTDDITAFFTEIFLTYFREFNWAYHDLYEDRNVIQQFNGYLLYLVLQYGNKQRESSFYIEKLLKAFPMIAENVPVPTYHNDLISFLSKVISTRMLSRFFDYWGFTMPKGAYRHWYKDKTVESRPILKQVIYLDKDKFQFSRGWEA